MPHKALLVPVDGTDAAKPAVDLAFQVAAEHVAHVTGFHVRTDSKDAVPLLGEGMSGAMIEEIIDLAEQESATHATKARAMFEAAVRQRGIAMESTGPGPNQVTAEWQEVTGREDEAVARRGRLADLIVVARPVAGQEVGSTLALNAALFETGRPVLVAPPRPPARVGGRVVISWNGSTECALAIGGAMPFIRMADTVIVLTAETEYTSSALGGDLARYLAWQGVTALTEKVAPGKRVVGEVLLKACADDRADLLVMGAYTHSRLRQLILGGVTQFVLANAELPVLMGH